uniref:Photosystem II protein L n=1 Tax=Laurus azorica TaxID=136121 RepID=A0A411LWE6_9MAGN|nr:photosystem II protein L [Laurus azorica]
MGLHQQTKGQSCLLYLY